MVFHIDAGKYDTVSLDGLNFALIAHAPDIMGKGDWSVGLITDERATSEQQQALTAIASGQAGGPPAGLGPLLGTFLGARVEANSVPEERYVPLGIHSRDTGSGLRRRSKCS